MPVLASCCLPTVLCRFISKKMKFHWSVYEKSNFHVVSLVSGRLKINLLNVIRINVLHISSVVKNLLLS